MSQKILVVEDDPATADFILKSLTGQGFVVDHASDGRDGLYLGTDGSYDAIVLDRMLPGMDGMAVLAALRAAHIATPVIILSSLGAVDARVEGLTSGANDYLTKPFAFSELLARLKLLIAKPSGGTQVEDQVVTRTMMLEGVWEYHFDPGTNVVDVHVSRLRRKVDDGFDKPLVHTIRGVGYILGTPG